MAHRTCELEFLLLFVCAALWWTVCLAVAACVWALAAECVNINFRYSFIHSFLLLIRVPIGKNGYVTCRSASRRISNFIFRHQRNVFSWKGRLLWISCKCSGYCVSGVSDTNIGRKRTHHKNPNRFNPNARRRCVQFNRVFFCQFSLVLHFRLEPHTKKLKSIWLRLCGREWRLGKCMFNCVTGTFIKIIIIMIITPLGKGNAKIKLEWNRDGATRRILMFT